jgi:hypothetical protein
MQGKKGDHKNHHKKEKEITLVDFMCFRKRSESDKEESGKKCESSSNS